MKYQFYSVRNGWNNGEICHDYYHSQTIEDLNRDTQQYVDWSGEMIVTFLEKKMNENPNNKYQLPHYQQLMKLASNYKDWYYYPTDTILYLHTQD